MDAVTTQSDTGKPSVLRKMKNIFRWARNDIVEEKDRKNVLKTFSKLRKVAIKERDEAVISQLRDDKLLQMLQNNLKTFHAGLNSHGSDEDQEDLEVMVNQVLELEEAIKRSNITIFRLNNIIINCSKHMTMIENM